MSTALFFLVPIGMLAVVWSACFVGCAFPTSGLPGGTDTTPTPYSNLILAEKPNLVAYWPLNEPMGATQANDLSGNGHNGTYTTPPAYPFVSSTTGTAPATSLAIASPTLAQGQGSLVGGDTGTGDQNTSPSSVDFDGSYVSIPWSTQIQTGLAQFTIEAWVQPGWSATDPAATYVLFDTRTPDFTGFAVFVGDDGNWAAIVGNGTTFVPIGSGQMIQFNSATYIAVTCDASGNVNFFINPTSDTAPAFPSTYKGVDQSQATFFIGAGVPFQPLRTTANGTGSPLFAFNGQIQDVALYDIALQGSDILSHFQNGNAQ